MVEETGEGQTETASASNTPPEESLSGSNTSDDTPTSAPAVKTNNAEKLNFLQNIEVQLAVEVGRTNMTIKDLLLLNEGSIVELDQMAGDPLNIIVNGANIAKGEIVMVGDKFGIRFVEISEAEKIAQSL
ncbi:MAG: flagellar motor switch protein FliN [Rhodospirillaceae bacterium]|nr:flagellar motor switch protein FliN [Rhodospirillaceae bacterium]